MISATLGELERLGEATESFTARKGMAVVENWSSVSALYKDYEEEVRVNLQGAARHLHPTIVQMWTDICKLGLEGKRGRVDLPIASREFKNLFPKCKIIMKQQSGEGETSV